MKDTVNTSDNDTLRAEIERLNKIIKALMDRAEQDMNTPRSDFGEFQTTIMLEDKVKTRTKELEEALQTNAKITRALQQANKLIEQNEQRLHDITSALGEGLLVMNQEGNIEFINTAACQLLGYTEDEVLGKNAHELFHYARPDHSPNPIQFCLEMQVAKTGKPHISDEEFFWRKDGTGFFVSVITTPILLKDNVYGAVLAFHDISQSIKERNRLREMQMAIEQSPASVLIVDKDKSIIYANPQISKATGYSNEELRNQKTNIFHGEQTPDEAYQKAWQTISSGSPWNGELLYRRKNGSVFWQSWRIAPVFDRHGVIQHYVGVGEDITEKKKIQAMLQEMSYQDGLTGIANRRRFDEFIDVEWHRASRSQKPLSIIMTDIDFFKRYNDSFGHQTGDECLKRIAHALKNKMLRTTDLLARYGGEEFVCVLPETDVNGAKVLAETLRQAIAALKLSNPDSDVSPYVTISLGVACCIPQQNTLFTELLAAADAALYRAKAQGRNRVEIATL
jgi:diguanylate cyclase (GGDEF)-like protein/PAS domain S-box-containing protein